MFRGRGLRQGMPLSPILSNFVLRDFDQAFRAKGFQLVRYADDLVVFAESEEACQRIQEFTISELGRLKLTLSQGKTIICNPAQPVGFLGMDLGLHQGSGKYSLTVSSDRMKGIRATFVRYHDWSIAQKEGLDIARLFRRIDQMRGGYSAAYSAADNITDLKCRMENWVRDCVTAIYTSIFGADSIKRLDSKKQIFLMVP